MEKARSRRVEMGQGLASAFLDCSSLALHRFTLDPHMLRYRDFSIRKASHVACAGLRAVDNLVMMT
jgi:hypothetical protein